MKPRNRETSGCKLRRDYLANETTEQRDIRLEAMRTQQRDHLANETVEQRKSWLQHRRQREQHRDYHRSNC